MLNLAEPTWSATARRRIAGRPLVLVGIGHEQLLGFAEAGAKVLGVVAVQPAGSVPAPVGAKAIPALEVAAASRDILELVVRDFADALAVHSDSVARFLDHVDPAREATVTSYLPVPTWVLDGRPVWATDSALARRLEDKDGAVATLSGAVPVVPSLALPIGPPTCWWNSVCERFGARRLVVQAHGLSGGGTGTWLCDVPDSVPGLEGGRVMPHVDGVPGNVMGVVDESGGTLVLPASRQLVRIAPDGRPLYAGNVTGEAWANDERDAIRAETVAIGAALADKGFVGPFGVDFLRTTDRRLYHDLNPRMNGVVDSIAFVVDRAGAMPFVPLLLSRTPWTPAEAAELEEAMFAAIAARPLARLWLTTVLEAPRVVQQVPAAGGWLVDPDGPSVQRTDDATIGGEAAVLHPTLHPGTYGVGDRLVLGDLFCAPDLAEAIGPQGGPALIDAFLA